MIHQQKDPSTDVTNRNLFTEDDDDDIISYKPKRRRTLDLSDSEDDDITDTGQKTNTGKDNEITDTEQKTSTGTGIEC